MELNVIDVSKNDRPRPVRSASGERRTSQARAEAGRGRSRNQERSGSYGDSPRRNSHTQRSQGSNVRRSPERYPAGNVRRISDGPGNGNVRRMPEREPRRSSDPVRQRAQDPRIRQERMRRKRKRRRQKFAARMAACLFLTALMILLIFSLVKLIGGARERERGQKVSSVTAVSRKEIMKANKSTQKPVITEDFLTVNEFSRPGEALPKVNNIFVHYTANRETSAAQNRSYFENLGITGETSASAHFIIGYEGEIIQCIPLDEIAYAVQKRNYDSISIECCYLSEDGKFTDATYQSLIRLSAWLLKEYKLTPEDMRRHYDEGGKKCPLYYVEHEEEWEQFLKDLEQFIMTQEDESV